MNRHPMSRRRLADFAFGAVVGVCAAIPVAGWTMGTHAPADATPAASIVSEAAGPGYPARALAVVDGDTFEARVAAFPGQEIVTRVRIAGIDAPERAGRCAGERNAAEAARAALAGRLEGRRLTLSFVRGDKYFGRVIARVETADGGDVAQALIADGHGRAYSGGRRGGWC